MNELITFIIWQSGINHLNRLLYEISQKFEIKSVYNLSWSKKDIIDNLNKLYPNREFDYNSRKLYECGFNNDNMRVFVIIVLDNTPNYEADKNLNAIIFKKKERNKHPESQNFLHCSDNESEAFYNLRSLIDIDKSEFMSLKNRKTIFCYCDILKYPHKIVCFEDKTFDSIQEVFEVLNRNVRWTVLRNWEKLPDMPIDKNHGDLDILVDKYYKTVALLRARKPKHINSQSYRVHHYVKIKSNILPVDIRYLGDNYYDLKWEIKLLNNRVYSKGFYRLNNKDYFWSLFYHAYIHKFSVSDEYKYKLNRLEKYSERKEKINYFISKPYYNLKYLNKFMKEDKYAYTKPIDKSVSIRYPEFIKRVMCVIKKKINNLKVYNKLYTMLMRINNRISLNKEIRNLLKNGFLSDKILINDEYFETLTRKFDYKHESKIKLVIVSYLPNKKTIPLLKICIESILKFTETPYELWIVDNNSPIRNLKWLFEYDNINLILNRTSPKEKGSYANAIGLEIATKVIDPDTKYFMTLHQDTAVCKRGWLKYMLSKFDNNIRAVGVRENKRKSREGLLHVLGYIIDYQLYKKLNLSFMPELPNIDVGDNAIISLKKAGYEVFAAPNTIWDKGLIDKIPDHSYLKHLNADRSFDDEGDVFFLHLGRGVKKALRKGKSNTDKSIKKWINTLNENLFPEYELAEKAEKKCIASISYSVRRFYVDKFFLENMNLFSDGDRILDIGGKKENKRGLFDIEQYNLKVDYANISKDANPDYLCDAADIPVEDNSYEGVILAEVLEHVREPKEVLEEARRVLIPGGRLLITVPFLFPIHADPYDYGRYTDYWLSKRLEELGFENIKIERQGNYYSVLSNNFKLLANEYNKISTLKNFTLKYFNLLLAKHYFLKGNRKSTGEKFINRFTTGFGIICDK